MRARRWAVVVAVAGILVAVPGAAVAQQPPTIGQRPTPEETMAKPPVLGDWVVPRGVEPDLGDYHVTTNCIQPATNGTQEQLNNTPWGQRELQLEQLHEFTRGGGVTVAVIDTGVQPHDYLTVRGGGDYVLKNENGLHDCDGHGTQVAGIIAAHPLDPQIGFVGVAPDATILSIRQSSGNYQGSRPQADGQSKQDFAGTLTTLAQAVVAAADQDVQVINMSVDSCRRVYPDGGRRLPITDDEKGLQAALRYANTVKDVVLVASAGNYDSRSCKDGANTGDPNSPDHLVLPPWFSEYVISVAAIQANGDPAPFSIPGPWVSVAAPGTEMVSLDPTRRTGLVNQIVTKDKEPQPIQGTSFAAPYVSGLAALIRSLNPAMTATEVRRQIELTAIHPAAPGGRDNRVGHGMVNPMAALTTKVPPEDPTAARARDMKADLPGPVIVDNTPMLVALIGSAGGVLLLLLTLFVVHTIRRNRPDSQRAARGHA